MQKPHQIYPHGPSFADRLSQSSIVTQREELLVRAFKLAGDLSLQNIAPDVVISLPQPSPHPVQPRPVHLPGFAPLRQHVMNLTGWSLERNTEVVPSKCQLPATGKPEQVLQTPGMRSGYILGKNGNIYQVIFLTDASPAEDPLRAPSSPEPIEALRAEPVMPIDTSAVADMIYCRTDASQEVAMCTSRDLDLKLTAYSRLQQTTQP